MPAPDMPLPPPATASQLPAELLLEVTQDGLWDWTLDTGHVAFSDTWCTMLGYAPADVTPHVSFWEQGVHPDDWPAIKASLEPHLRGETPMYQCEHRVRHKDGTWRWILDRGMVIDRAPDGRALRMMGSHVDVTWRVEVESAAQRAQAMTAAQLSILEHMVSGAEVPALLAQIVAFVEAEAPGFTVAVLVPDEWAAQLTYAFTGALPADYVEAMPLIPIADGAGSCGTAAFTRQRVAVDDIERDPRWAIPRQWALPHGLRACTSLPLMARGGDLVGVLALYRSTPGPIATVLEPLIDLAAHLTAIVLERDADERSRVAREEDQRFLADLTGDMQSTLSLRERGARAVRRLARHFGVPSAGWLTVDVDGGTLSVQQEWRGGGVHDVHVVAPLAGWPPFDAHTDLLAINDTAADARVASAHAATFATLGHRAALAFGLFRGGRWVGVIFANDVRPRRWTAREQQLMRVAADRIWSALDVARALEEADRERRRLQAVLEALPVGVVVTDAKGQFVYVNDRVSQIWGGAPRPDGVGEYGVYRGWWAHNDQLIRAEDWALARALTRGEVSSGELIRIARFDGGSAMMLNAGAPIRNDAGEITGAVVVVEDVSEQMRLADVNAQLTEASRRKSAFVSYLSHELRTPLNAIMGFTELLHDDVLGPVSDLQREVLVDMLSSGRHLLRLLDDVLDTARIEAGKLELRRETIELPPFVDDVIGSMRTQAEAKKVVLSASVDRDVSALPFVADPARLRQMLFNYLSNAIKFTGRNGRVHLHVGRTVNDRLRFSVSDTGIGIAAEHQTRLFVDFEQVEGNASGGGWGLGLALTRRLVEAHGGEVGVESTPGIGSNFWADYPLPVS